MRKDLNLSCLDVAAWRIYTKDEMLQYLEGIRSKTNTKKKRGSKKAFSLERGVTCRFHFCLKSCFGKNRSSRTLYQIIDWQGQND
ncbi:MAG: hypothetical protein SFW64_02310 [Alphaproteobacteria bacterium]|nr:hypothetical protein [Alphaproteobacteria bacterium]